MQDFSDITPVVYVAGPYREGENRTVETNIKNAREYAVKLWVTGYWVLTPHLNTAHMELFAPEVSDKQYRDFYLHMLQFCDAVFAIPRWSSSEGSIEEVKLAAKLEIPVFYDLEDLHEARANGAFKPNSLMRKVSALSNSNQSSTGYGESKC